MINRVKPPLMVLLLVMGAIFTAGCDKNDEEEPLGGSRPIPNMLFPIADLGLYNTEWHGTNGGSNLVINFDREDCTFSVTVPATGKTTTTIYVYEYNHPVVSLTPENENESTVSGTTISGRPLDADEMSFVDANDTPVWMRVIRKK